MTAPARGTDAPAPVHPLDWPTFERLCRLKGAVTEDDRAELAGVDRGTVRRWLRGEVSPLLSKAQFLARRLNTTVDELWKDESK